MKKSLFAIALDLMLVAALVFVVAPSAKAEDTPTKITPDKVLTKDGEEINVVSDMLLDLAGHNATVNVDAGVILSVIDTGNTKLDGTCAGTLTVSNKSEGRVVGFEDLYDGTRFLKVATGSNTYSFHPCFVQIEEIGVNTSKSALCLKITYVTNKAAQKAVESGVVYGVNPDAMTSAADTFGAFEFEGAVLTAYFDLVGSLDTADSIKESRTFQAYIKSGDQTVANFPIKITPETVLINLNEKANTNKFDDTQKAKMKAMIEGKAHLEALCPNFLGNASATPIIADGKYHIVARCTDEKYYAMTDNCADKAYLKAEKITLNDGVVTGNATAWTITNDGEGNVTLMSPKGVYLMRQDKSANILLGQTAVKWLVAKNEAKGTYTLQNTNTDERCLSYNGTGFKAYGVPTEHVIELLIIPANEDAPQPEYLLHDGKYNVVVEYTGDKYFAMTGTYDKPNGCMTATNVTVSDGIVTGDATAWTLTNDGMGNVTLMSPEGKYLIREEGKSNILLGETAEKWLVAKDEKTGFYTLQHTHIDVRYLAYNGTGFKAYEKANDVRVIELLIVPVG